MGGGGKKGNCKNQSRAYNGGPSAAGAAIRDEKKSDDVLAWAP